VTIKNGSFVAWKPVFSLQVALHNHPPNMDW